MKCDKCGGTKFLTHNSGREKVGMWCRGCGAIIPDRKPENREKKIIEDRDKKIEKVEEVK